MSLREELVRQIARLGPLTVAEYMAQCLYHPRWGYYRAGRPIGARGDFVTAPEISQMFGEMLGLWLAQVWLDQGRPAPFVLAELGPGTGQLMDDALRATRGVPGFHAAARLALVEVNADLRAQQAERLAAHRPEFADDLSGLPDGPLFLLANEFFDCLPVRQFLRGPEGWMERVVTAQGGELAFALRPAGALGEGLPADWPEGRVLELSPAASAIAAALAERIGASGGAALIVDYGGQGEGGDTLQALRGHAKLGPLEAPGESDLTAHVDFAALVGAAAPFAQVFGPVPQGVLLERLGITARAQALARGLSGDALEMHIAAHRRLTHPAEMGDLFKGLAILPRGAAAPPGFG